MSAWTRKARLCAAIAAVLPLAGSSAVMADSVKSSKAISVFGPLSTGNSGNKGNGNANGNGGAGATPPVVTPPVVTPPVVTPPVVTPPVVTPPVVTPPVVTPPVVTPPVTPPPFADENPPVVPPVVTPPVVTPPVVTPPVTPLPVTDTPPVTTPPVIEAPPITTPPSDGTSPLGNGNDSGNNTKIAGPDSDAPNPYPDFVIELLTHGASGVGNGAIYSQEDFQPTGTGVFLPFLRIQETGPGKDGIEAGYNTDARPVDLDTKDGNHWTHSLESETPEVVVSGGTEYIAFRLDVNEQGNSDDRIIWLNKLDVYLGAAPDLTLDSPGGLGQLIYSLDGGAQGDGSIKLDYRLEHGSGSGDMQVLIPKALFAPDRYIYLFSEFSGADAGFEEWSARVAPVQTPPPPPPPVVPLPAAVWGGIVLLGGLGVGRRMRSQKERAFEG